MATRSMIYKRKYLQFNDLVFDGYDMIQDYDNGGTSFKETSQDLPYKHGSHVTFKSSTVLAESVTVSLTLKLLLKKVPCEMREYYVEFATRELTKPGKLWAVKNNTVMWAYAYLSNYKEVEGYEKNMFEIDVDFTLYEGIWHKADLHKTFLEEYDVCGFLSCYGYRPRKKCSQDNCCTDCYEIHTGCDCCECDNITKENALCYMQDNLDELFRRCGGGYHIVYDCAKAAEFTSENYLGEKICTKDSCSNIIAGQYYSNTDIPTDQVSFIISGASHNPSIEVNGNRNIIKGDYDGALYIYANGDIYTKSSDCCDPALVDVRNWSVPKGHTYGWTLQPGNNSIVIDTHDCCGVNCVYVQSDPITL